MKMPLFKMFPFFFLLMLFPFYAGADGNSIQDLEQKLKERDKVILELLDRIEALEQRVGIKYTSDESGKSSNETLDRENEKNSGPIKTPEETPGKIIVDEESAERALRRSLTREGALLLPSGILEVEPGITYSRKEESSPLLFSSDGQLFAGKNDTTADSYIGDLTVRLGLPWDSQLEVGAPYLKRRVKSINYIGTSATDSISRSAAAPGDLRIGFAKTILRESLWLPNLVGRILWDSDSGKISDDGVSLGGGFNEFRGSLTGIKRQDPVVFFGGLAFEYSLEKDNFKPGPAVSANFGSFIALSPETSVRFLVSGTHQDESKFSGNQILGSDRDAVSFLIGGSTLIAPRRLLNISVGFGLTDDADDFSISISLPLRFNNRLF